MNVDGTDQTRLTNKTLGRRPSRLLPRRHQNRLHRANATETTSTSATTRDLRDERRRNRPDAPHEQPHGGRRRLESSRPAAPRIAFAERQPRPSPTADIYALDGTLTARATRRPDHRPGDGLLQPDWGSNFQADRASPSPGDGPGPDRRRRHEHVQRQARCRAAQVKAADGERDRDLRPAAGHAAAHRHRRHLLVGPIDESVYTSAADSGTAFRITACQYHYNLHVRPLGLGQLLGGDPDQRRGRGQCALRAQVGTRHDREKADRSGDRRRGEGRDAWPAPPARRTGR